MKAYEFLSYDDFKRAAVFLHEKQLLIKAYSPLPDDELIGQLGFQKRTLCTIAVGGAILGGIGGFLLQYIPNAHTYSMNIGGRPLNSWPAFLLISFEVAVLVSALSVVGGFIYLNGLPRFDEEIFDLENFHQFRHERFYIITQEEVSHVKADGLHDLSP